MGRKEGRETEKTEEKNKRMEDGNEKETVRKEVKERYDGKEGRRKE